MIRRLAALATLAASLGACQTLAETGAPARVNLADPGTRAVVLSVLAEAMHRKPIELGPAAAPETSSLSVLPPRPTHYETNSTAMPVRFDVVREGGKCRLIRQDTHEGFDLPGVDCTPM